MSKDAIDAVAVALEKQLGSALKALYRFGSYGSSYYLSGYSDINLLAVVADTSCIHDVRAAFLPLWPQHKDVLRRAPLIADEAALQRHLQLYPLFAHHLATSGRLLLGDAPLLPAVAPPHESERLAYLARENIEASAALVPSLLPRPAAAAAYRRLHRLARQLYEQPLPVDMPAQALYAHVQARLQPQFNGAPGAVQERLVDSRRQPNLLAIYEETDHVVMVIPSLAPELLREIEWQLLSERLEQRATFLQVATMSQLRLSIQCQAPLGFALGRYRRQWGKDPLARVTVAAWAVLREAARIPASLLVDEIPNAYLTSADEDTLHAVIHDYQNRLLNLGLQHELLHRLHGVADAEPPEQLPGRSQPLPVRVEAILNQLGWWSAHYMAEMARTPDNLAMLPE